MLDKDINTNLDYPNTNLDDYDRKGLQTTTP